jgi:hypothetical protein
MFSWTFYTFEGEATTLCRNVGHHSPSGRGVAFTTHLHVLPRLKKEYKYTSSLLGFNVFL